MNNVTQRDTVLPKLGDSPDHVHTLMTGHHNPNADLIGSYLITLASEALVLTVLYAREHDGRIHVMQLNFHSPDAISQAARTAIVHSALGNSRAARWRDMPPRLQADGEGNGREEDYAIFTDARLRKRLENDWYYAQPGGSWLRKRCPNSPASAIEYYTSRNEAGDIDRIGIFSPYLDKCQYKIGESI